MQIILANWMQGEKWIGENLAVNISGCFSMQLLSRQQVGLLLSTDESWWCRNGVGGGLMMCVCAC